MSENKVLFGLDKTHVAFQNNLPGKTFAVLTAPTADGNLTVTVTAADVTGSPKEITVAVATATETSAALVAQEIADAVNADTAVKVNYVAAVEGTVVIIKRKTEPIEPDETFDVTVAVAATGVTVSSVLATTILGYETPIPVEGAVNLALDPEGEESTFYADNGPYFTFTSNNGYSGDLELAKLPDAIAVPMLGYLLDAQGMVIEVAGGDQRPFALLCQYKGDKKNRKMVFYNCNASRPNEEHTTQEDGIEVNTQTLPLIIQPIEIGGKNVVKGAIELATTANEQNTLAYNNFFYQVILPKFS
jgi:phi13 family phage major tail protein